MTSNLESIEPEDDFESIVNILYHTLREWAEDPGKRKGFLSVRGYTLNVDRDFLDGILDHPQESKEGLYSWLEDVCQHPGILYKSVSEFPTAVSEPMVSSSVDALHPPKLGQVCLCLFLSKATRNAALGDLEENYYDACRRFGKKIARRMYWWDVARSLFPLVEASIVRVSKWAGLAALGQIFRHFVK